MMQAEIFKTVETTKKVAISGDWHGDTTWALDMIRAVHDRGIKVILHVGDFGIWPGKSGASYLRKVNNALADRGMILLLTAGNHEDYTQIGKAEQVEGMPDGFKARAHAPHVIILDRPTRWMMGGRSFISVGGANSIDFQGRTLGKDYWLEEQITDEQVDLAREGGHAEIMISHDTATGVMDGIVDSASEWTDEGFKYAQKSSDQLKRITDDVRPVVNFFGHYHRFINRTVTLRVPFMGDYAMRAVCLDMQRRAGNTVIFDIEAMSMDEVSIWGLRV